MNSNNRENIIVGICAGAVLIAACWLVLSLLSQVGATATCEVLHSTSTCAYTLR